MQTELQIEDGEAVQRYDGRDMIAKYQVKLQEGIKQVEQEMELLETHSKLEGIVREVVGKQRLTLGLSALELIEEGASMSVGAMYVLTTSYEEFPASHGEIDSRPHRRKVVARHHIPGTGAPLFPEGSHYETKAKDLLKEISKFIDQEVDVEYGYSRKKAYKATETIGFLTTDPSKTRELMYSVKELLVEADAAAADFLSHYESRIRFPETA